MRNASQGIGSEFALSPKLLKPTQPSKCLKPLKSNRVVWLNSGRSALLWSIYALRMRFPKRSVCLLPGYLCPSVAQPFKEAGVDVVFYRMNEHLCVDLKDLRSRLNRDVLAVVIIHYFGVIQPQTLFDLVVETDPEICIIEDMAHAWLSHLADGQSLPQRGKIAVYSPRKFFPVPDVGMAVVKDDTYSFNAPVAHTDWSYALQRTVGLFLRWVYAKTGIRVANYFAFVFLRRAENKLDTSISVSQASWMSRWIFRNLNFEVTAQHRRENYEILNKDLQTKGLSVQPLFQSLPTGVTPLGLPILCEKRDELKKFLIKRHIYPPIHWILPQNPSVDNFYRLCDLSRHILTLPIDQRYRPHDMEYISKCLTEWDELSVK